MAKEQDFVSRIESKVLQQLRSQSVGFLLGAGASCLDGQGYPLASDIWLRIKDNLEKVEKDSIQAKLDAGADGLEQALDLLDEGNPDGMPLRYKVAKLIGDDFRTINPPLVIHREFIKALARSKSYSLHIFVSIMTLLSKGLPKKKPFELSMVLLALSILSLTPAYFNNVRAFRAGNGEG